MSLFRLIFPYCLLDPLRAEMESVNLGVCMCVYVVLGIEPRALLELYTNSYFRPFSLGPE
jgi:hypothetical protein